MTFWNWDPYSHFLLIGPKGDMRVPDRKMWNTIEERTERRRHLTNAIAHSGLSLEELHLFFFRASLEAARSWNSKASFLGRLKNMMTTSHVGFAEVPGRILAQALKQLAENPDAAISPAATYLLRVDVAMDLRDQFKALLEDAA